MILHRRGVIVPTSKRLFRWALASLFVPLSVSASIAAAPDARLVDAAAEQNWKAVSQLLRAGVAADSTRPDKTTALIWAAHWDNRETVTLLLKSKANVNAAEDHGVTALARACENASPAMVEMLLNAGANPNVAQTSGLTPLMIAAETGNLPVVQALLKRGANANAKTVTTGTTALMWAVTNGHQQIARALIDAGADVRVSSAKGFTPLVYAARFGDIEAAKMLLAAGAGVNEPGSDGTHALPMAIVDGHANFALFLLEEGADPNKKIDGVSPLHAAAGDVSTWLFDWQRLHGSSRRGGGGERLTLDQRLTLVKALLAKGAEPNAQIPTSAAVISYTLLRGAFHQNAVGTGDVGRATPLWVAGISVSDGLRGEFGENYKPRIDSSPAIMKALLDAGADVSLKTNDGTTPLMITSGLGPRTYSPTLKRGTLHPEALAAVKVLVEAGAEVNARNEADFTALHAATMRGWNEMVQYLVEHGADINARDYRGRTPFRLAEGGKQNFELQAWPATAELLVKLGADTRLGIPGTILERADHDVAGNEQ